MKKKIKSKIHLSPTKIKTIILSITIALVLILLVINLITAIYPKPEWTSFCEEPIAKAIAPEREPIPEPTSIPDYSECQKQYENSLNSYKLIVFIVAIIIGLITVSAGIILRLPSVSSGLMLGGTFLVFYGAGVYWSNLNNLLRALILGIALIILIWLGYRKLEN